MHHVFQPTLEMPVGPTPGMDMARAASSTGLHRDGVMRRQKSMAIIVQDATQSSHSATTPPGMSAPPATTSSYDIAPAHRLRDNMYLEPPLFHAVHDPSQFGIPHERKPRRLLRMPRSFSRLSEMRKNSGGSNTSASSTSATSTLHQAQSMEGISLRQWSTSSQESTGTVTPTSSVVPMIPRSRQSSGRTTLTIGSDQAPQTPETECPPTFAQHTPPPQPRTPSTASSASSDLRDLGDYAVTTHVDDFFAHETGTTVEPLPSSFSRLDMGDSPSKTPRVETAQRRRPRGTPIKWGSRPPDSHGISDPLSKVSNINLRRLFKSSTNERPPVVQEVPPLPPLPPLPNPAQVESSRAVRRVHAIRELIDTERSYAADLGVARDVYLLPARQFAGVPSMEQRPSVSRLDIPAGLHSDVPHSAPIHAPSRSASSDSTHRSVTHLSSSKSDASLTSSLESFIPLGGAPLSPSDIYVVFAGLEPCVSLASTMATALGEAKDVSQVFLENIDSIERIYTYYCARHEAAAARLAELSHDPGPAAFLRECDNTARKLSTSWDLLSLLIKPVQRILKYPLLLHAIISSTPPTNEDYPTLCLAAEQIEAVANRINAYKKRLDDVGQHGFVPPVNSRGTFRLNSGTLRIGRQNQYSDAPAIDTEGALAVLRSRLVHHEERLDSFSQECSSWLELARQHFAVQYALVDQWIALYELNGPRPEAERLYAYAGTLHSSLGGLVMDQLETELDRTVHAVVRAAHSITSRAKIVVANRDAKEGEYRRYRSELARRPGLKPNPSVLAFISLHDQLLEELPALLRGLDLLLDACFGAFARIQRAYYMAIIQETRIYDRDSQEAMTAAAGSVPAPGFGPVPALPPTPVAAAKSRHIADAEKSGLAPPVSLIAPLPEETPKVNARRPSHVTHMSPQWASPTYTISSVATSYVSANDDMFSSSHMQTQTLPQTQTQAPQIGITATPRASNSDSYSYPYTPIYASDAHNQTPLVRNSSPLSHVSELQSFHDASTITTTHFSDAHDVDNESDCSSIAVAAPPISPQIITRTLPLSPPSPSRYPRQWQVPFDS